MEAERPISMHEDSGMSKIAQQPNPGFQHLTPAARGRPYTEHARSVTLLLHKAEKIHRSLYLF